MNNYSELNEIKYKKIGETKETDEKQKNWNIAFGLQEVDNLKPSKYMISLAKENIKGNKSYELVEKEIKAYYSNQKSEQIDKNEKEADEVSLRIVKILNDKAFTFNYLTLKQYHKLLFNGIDIGIKSCYIGDFRNYNISKEEPILNGDTVQYADFNMIEETLKYDFDEESQQKYVQMNDNEKIKRLVRFTSNIWQVHPFGEGNTRTTAVFIQKYLISKGFEIDNQLFKDNSLYFRNALVRANYSNIKKGVEEDNSYLVSFFENLLLNKNNDLNNNNLYLKNKTEDKSADNIINNSFYKGRKR